MILRAILFFSTLLIVLGGSCWYLTRRSLALLPYLPRAPWAVHGFFVLFVVLLVALPVLHRLFPSLDRLLVPFYGLAYLQFSFVSTYLVYLLGADLLQFTARRVFGAHAALGAWAGGAALVLSLLSVLAGLWTALKPVPLRRLEVAVAGLPEALAGFRIVQISDLHLGPLVRRAQVDHVVETANAQAADLIAITGDLVDGEADGVKDKARRLGALRATHGVFFVTGNHEYYSGAEAWLKEIRGLGWTALHNEHRLLTHADGLLAVAGMPDPAGRGRKGSGGPDLARTLAGIPREAFRLLLFHPPTGIEAAAKAGVRLQLSGHTHGGQYFPWSLLVQRLWRHPSGLHPVGEAWIHTSPGTGFWGPPNRFLVPPELTLLVLTPGPAPAGS